jgi:hypothetical protein
MVLCDTAARPPELGSCWTLTIRSAAHGRCLPRFSYGVGMAPADVSHPLPRAAVAMVWVLAGLFNITLVSFFNLYSIANGQAADRSEANGAFDPSQLLPHDAALWMTANASIALLLVLDVVGIALFVRAWLRRRAAVR